MVIIIGKGNKVANEIFTLIKETYKLDINITQVIYTIINYPY